MITTKAPPYVTPPIRHVGFRADTGDIVVVDQHRNEVIVVSKGDVIIDVAELELAYNHGWEPVPALESKLTQYGDGLVMVRKN